MTTTRAVAATAVHAVVAEGRSLDDAFAEGGINELPARERAFVKALSFGTLRVHLRNQALLAQLLDKPIRRKDAVVAALLSVALHELIDSPAPEYAVVSAAVDATRALRKPALRGLVNAILRRFQRERAQRLAAVSDESARCNYPQWLIDAARADWPDEWQEILQAGNEQAPMWLRVNAARNERDDYNAKLAAAGLDVVSTPSAFPNALRLSNAVPVGDLPGFADGACSVQDAASQLAADLLDASPGMRVLDACAAPGGKTCHLLERAGNELQLVALDNSAARLERVRENLTRLQLSATVICGDALEPDSWWDGQPFDRILVDAPCSATGVIRRHPDIRFLRRADDIAALQGTQSAMLRALWPMLREGGRLVYSTCSFLRAENDAVVGDFLQQEASARSLDTEPLLTAPFAVRTLHGMQLLPGREATDGFYYALMERCSS